MSALMLAVESGHFQLALNLVNQGADPNDQRSGYAPLHAVTWVRKADKGDNVEGDPEPRGSGDLTSIDFVRELIKAGADVNLKIEKGKSPGKCKLNRKGLTPLLLASRTADIELMNLLLESGADPKLTNADGCTTIMAAAGVGVVAVGEEAGTEEEVDRAIEILAELGVDPNVVDKNGETAMHGAAYRNYPSAVTTLANLGADSAVWNRKNKHGWKPHDIASGKRPGSFKPSPPTERALDAAMKTTD
jgi:ankyrin repeat protein